MLKDENSLLRHILVPRREAVSFARGHVWDDLETNRQLVLALVKDIEIVGEDASQIAEDTRSRTLSIPRQDSCAMNLW